MEPASKKRRVEEAAQDVGTVQPDKLKALLHLPPVVAPEASTGSGLEDSADADLLAQLPSDLEAAIQSLRTQFMQTPGCEGLPPIILKTQLHSIISNRTDMERELDQLRRSNRIRMFKLATGADEHGILLTDDYVRLVRDAAATAAAAAAAAANQPAGPSTSGHAHTATAASTSSTPGSTQQQVADSFCTHVVPQHTDISISHHRVSELLRLAARARPQPASAPPPAAATPPPASTEAGRPSSHAPASRACTVTLDTQVSMLLNMGIIARHPADDHAYLFGVPNLGIVVKSIIAGRKELASVVARKRYKEVPEKQLLASCKLRQTRLGVHFHICDLLGKGILKAIQTTSGTLLKLVQSIQ